MARHRCRSDGEGELFRDRGDTGARLADRVAAHPLVRPLVLGIATGGVVVAADIARRLGAELDVVVVHPLTTPRLLDLSIGAVAASGHAILADDLRGALDVSTADLPQDIAAARSEARRHQVALRGAVPEPRLAGRSVVLVDDGMATGQTMRAAIRSVRVRRPGSLVVAVPVGSRAACVALQGEVDDLVCLYEPAVFQSIGLYYLSFDAVDDDEVRRLLQESRERRVGEWPPAGIPAGE